MSEVASSHETGSCVSLFLDGAVILVFNLVQAVQYTEVDILHGQLQLRQQRGQPLHGQLGYFVQMFIDYATDVVLSEVHDWIHFELDAMFRRMRHPIIHYSFHEVQH